MYNKLEKNKTKKKLLPRQSEKSQLENTHNIGFCIDNYDLICCLMSLLKGKMQTPGGAAFEKDCVCTTIDVSGVQGATNGDATAVNSCRKLEPSGEFLNATGKVVGYLLGWKKKMSVAYYLHGLSTFLIESSNTISELTEKKIRRQ